MTLVNFAALHPYETRVRDFYAAFARRDAEAMARCYHRDVFFSDPIFPRLRGEEAADMWRMLLGRASDLVVTLDEVHADDEGAHAKWTARYAFGARRRPVVNRVSSLFAFRSRLIVRHYDHFGLWRWASQAFGPAGALLGWSMPFRWKVRRDAMQRLEAFREASRNPDDP